MIYKVNLNKDEVLYSDQIRIILQYLKEQNKQSVVDVARILGYSPGTLVSVADEKYIVGSHTRRQTLIRLLRSFKLDMSVYKNIGKGYKIQLLEYHDNADQPFQYLAIGFSEAKDQLIFYDIKVDFSDNRIVIITDEGEVHSGIIDRNLVSSEMKSTTGGDIQFILNERISLDRRKLMRFATGRVSTGILRIIHLNQTRLQEVLISQYETIKQSEENLEIIKSFLSTPKLLRAFQNAKDRTFSNLRSIVKAYLENRRNLTVELPPELLLPYRQFLSYFPEFVKQTSGVDIQVDIVTRGNKLEIQIDTFANLKMKEVGEYLKEYIGFTRQDLTRLKVSVQSDLSEKDFNLLILDLKHQVTSLKHSLELAQLRNQLLQTDVDYLRQLSSDFANKDTTIHVQNISGGDQQFADKIKNQKP